VLDFSLFRILGETVFTCKDCPSGSSDGICDQLKDGICDPDCSKERDWDCHCGDGVCDEKLGEDEDSCPKDCGKCNFNGICEVELGENFLNCADCPSGSKDGYCDKIKDGICDEDCKPQEDPDCKAGSNLLLLIIPFLILVALFIFLFLKKRKESIWEELKQKWKNNL